MARKTKLDAAIQSLEDEIRVLQLAIAKLKAQQPTKPKLVKPAKTEKPA